MSVSHAAQTILHVTDLLALFISIKLTKITYISCTVILKTEYNYLKKTVIEMCGHYFLFPRLNPARKEM